MPLTLPLSYPFYTGGGSSSEVPSRYDIALDGRPYMLDLASDEFTHQTVPLLRGQADQGASPSESSINPDDLWRRSVDTWHLGAGQSVLDRKDSDLARFHTSKGVDVWTRWQLGLLPATDQKKSSANTNLALVVAGGYLYLCDGASIQYTQDVSVGSPTWTDITGEPAAPPVSMASDGFNIWTAHTASGIYGTTRGGATTAQLISDPVTLVAYVKGRVMAAYTNSIYNVTDFTTPPNTLPAALLTHPNTDFTWVGFADGQTVIYAAGYSGDKSLIYRTAIKADGTALDVPAVAGELPDGEIVRSIQGYLGFLLIGTDEGVRVAQADSSGNLLIGSLIPTGSAVKCFEPQDRFCWYGLTNYDSVSTGLGRLDLSMTTAPLTPAYASDLMVTGQGAVLSCVTFQNLRVFAVSGLGIYGQDTALVASGTVDSGQITYSLPDDKVAMFVDVHHDLTGAHTVALSTDGGAFSSLGTHRNEDFPFTANQSRGSRHEVRLTLSTVSTVGPTIRSWTLRSYPTAAPVRFVMLPILLHETLVLHNGAEEHCDVAQELANIDALRTSRRLVPLQNLGAISAGVVEDYIWKPHSPTADFEAWNGTCFTRVKVISE